MSLKDKVSGAVAGTLNELGDTIADEIKKGGTAVAEEIRGRTSAIIGVVKTANVTPEKQHAQIDEASVVKVIPDERSISGFGLVMAGLICLLVSAWWFGLLFFVAGAVRFLMGPLWTWKVDVPDGWSGVECRNGKPVGIAKQGRTWIWNILRYIPAVVTKRELTLEITSAGHTGDYATIARSDLYVLRIENPAIFSSQASLPTVVKLLHAYARMTHLRIISSIRDSRVKFARGKLVNVAQEINRHLLPMTGVSVHECTPSQVTNVVLDDLEYVRTQLASVRMLVDDLRTKTENAQKMVEQQRRTGARAVVNTSLELQQEYGALLTAITQRMNSKRQALTMEARQKIDRAVSAVTAEVALVKARIRKAAALQASFGGIQTANQIRLARIKRAAYCHMTPRVVQVLGVSGIGAGLGMSMGNELMGKMMSETEALGGKGGDEKPSESSTAKVIAMGDR